MAEIAGDFRVLDASAHLFDPLGLPMINAGKPTLGDPTNTDPNQPF